MDGPKPRRKWYPLWFVILTIALVAILSLPRGMSYVVVAFVLFAFFAAVFRHIR